MKELKNRGQIAMGLKIALGIMATAVFTFGGWVTTSMSDKSAIDREQDKEITENRTNLTYMRDDLKEIKSDIKTLLRSFDIKR